MRVDFHKCDLGLKRARRRHLDPYSASIESVRSPALIS
jgi:hypothetical protein